MASPKPGYVTDDLQDLRGNALIGADVEVFEAGTSTLATLYSDEDRTPLDNPLPAAADLTLPGIDAAANFTFYAEDTDNDGAPVEYDVRVTYQGRVLDPFRVNPTPSAAALGSLSYVQVNELPRSPLQAVYGGAFTPAAVMAAAVGGAAVHLPVGTCVGAISLPGGTVLTGVPGKSVLQAAAGAATNVVTNADSGAITLEDLVVDGAKSAVTSGTTLGHGVLLTSDGSKARRLILRNTRLSGVRILNADDCLVEHGEFTDCGASSMTGDFLANGVTVSGHRNRVQHNKMTGTAGMGVAQSALAAGLTSFLTVHRNDIFDSGIFGIALGSFATDSEVTHNLVKGSADNSIDTGSTRGCKITDNRCYDGYDGIDIDLTGLAMEPEDEDGILPDVDILIANNVCKRMARYGIVVGALEPVTGLQVLANKVDTTDLHGITVENFWRSVIAHNTIRRWNMNAASGFAAISLWYSSRHNLIEGNTAFEDRLTHKGLGYVEQPSGGSFGYNRLVNNDLSECLAPYPTAATANDIRMGNV